MAVYFIRKSGSDSNAGTSAATAWLTFSKALKSGGLASGDTVYVGAGVYREIVGTVTITAPTAKTSIIGDVDGSQTGDAGAVILSAFTSGDSSSPSGSELIDLNGRPWLDFENITFVGGSNGSYVALDGQNATGAHDLTLKKCVFISMASSGTIMSWWGTASGVANWLIDSCIFISAGLCIELQTVTNASADYDINFVVQNCTFLAAGGSAGVLRARTASGSGSFHMGGPIVRNVTAFGMFGYGVQAQTGTISTTVAMKVTNSLFLNYGGGAVLAATAGQIVEDYNVFSSSSPRTNVTAGSHSIVGPGFASLVDYGQLSLHGLVPHPFLSPLAGSKMLGFGDDGTAPSVDALNRPRPAGGSSTAKAAGAYELHDTARIGSALGADSGGYIELVGPADHDFAIPVDAASTTISVKVTWDSNHGNTNKPQAILLAAPQIGVTTETKTATGTAGSAYETLTFTAQTPTAKGVVIVRLVSRAAAGNGIAAYDTFAVS